MKVLLTGGSRGIGQAIKKKFIEFGCEVIAPDRSALNLSERTSILNYLKQLEPEIDVLINNAGVNYLNDFLDVSLGDIERTFEVNTIAPLLISQHCIKEYFIPKKEGCIINIGTLWNAKSRVGRSSYAMSKAALESLTKSIAIEYGKYNIRCNMISPGFVGTDLTYKNNTQEELKQIIDKIPLNRLADTEEIADLVVDIALKNKYLTGQNIYIDGGLSKSF
jgi:NAD(P)-dependent dehydrogenase (short-subunit alcohol dehydrogenase family)